MRERGDPHGSTRETFVATEHAVGPWDPRVLHGGPVAALLARAMDRLDRRDGTRVARVSVNLLGPVPLGRVRVSAQLRRPGRRISMVTSLLETEMPDGTWRPAATGEAWRLSNQDTSSVMFAADAPIGLPEHPSFALPEPAIPASWREGGFVSALDWRSKVTTEFGRRGEPTVAWMRLARPLVSGEPTTGLERAVAIADVANGLGARLYPFLWTFLNTDLTVQLFAPPTGEWFALEAESSIGPDGVGMGSAVMHQEDGTLGRLTQTLLVERRVE